MPDRRALLVVLAALSGSGCVRGCTMSHPPVHLERNMFDQPKYKPQDASAFFYDGATMRAPVPGTVARGDLRLDRARYEGLDDEGRPVAAIPLPVTDALRDRGAERYHIYCEPCHDARGDGKGILFQRGNVPTASLHSDKVRGAPDGHLFDVITNGQGLMPAYRWPIPPEDRWAIVARVREMERQRQEEGAAR